MNQLSIGSEQNIIGQLRFLGLSVVQKSIGFQGIMNLIVLNNNLHLNVVNIDGLQLSALPKAEIDKLVSIFTDIWVKD